MLPIVIVLAIATFISTLIGGLAILKFRKSLPYFFAFASGSLIAVAFLDILPESIELADSIAFPVRYVMLTVVASFFFYSLLERFFLTHHLDEHDGHEGHGHIMGPIGAGSLVVHSFLDGAAIGAAFQVSQSIGLLVALAVIFHDFTDGINTVTLMLKNKQHPEKALLFLVLDALAPVLGVIFTTAILIPQNVLALLLAAFVGEFIYIGASTLLPETKQYDQKWTVISMAGGIVLIAILTSLI